ncbi:hypothetical protein [Aeromonas sp. Y311-2]|uniref:hypothetical protein n=1 Tax=Aeromonas sp. Y311-2 TaxID=2990507 RepID=UPI0022E49CF7|nr:hypothetical protein [Aeromonas sp. Y311-2]
MTGSRHLELIRIALRPLEKWGCTPIQQQNILQVPLAELEKYRGEEAVEAYLDEDQLLRVTIVLNIHFALVSAFRDQERTFSFMGKENHSAEFDGKTPLSLIESGDFENLVSVMTYTADLRGKLTA